MQEGKISKIGFLLIALLYVFSMLNIRFGKDHFKHTVLSDARGYYAYLPAWVVYDDLQFEFQSRVDPVYWPEDQHVNYRIFVNGGFSNKYFAGVGLSALPFYALAHAYVKATNGVADGFSKPYVLSISLASCFYALLGLFCCTLFMSMHGVRYFHQWLAIAVLAFGTQLFYYTISEAGMSHAYSFGWFSIFLLMFSYWLKGGKEGHFFMAAFALGMVVLIRPVNILPVLFFLPFILLFNGIKLSEFFQSLLKQRIKILPAAILLMIPLMVQFWCYYKTLGQIWVDGYAGETFDFLHPHLWDILFSFRKGLFIYTPLCLLIVPALLYWFKQKKMNLVFSWLLGMLLTTWLFSSWWSWYYGGSFGLRAYIEFYPLFILPFALVLNHFSKKLRTALTVSSLLLILFCQLQTWQYRHNIIHWDNMDFKSWVALYYPRLRI